VIQSDANIGSLQKFINPAFAPDPLIVIVFFKRLGVESCRGNEKFTAQRISGDPDLVWWIF
jgi:hypothetical protein